MEAANYGILSLIPLALTLLLAFWKKDAVFALFMGCLSGVLLLGHDPAFGFSALAKEALGNEDFIWILLIQVFIGIMIAFFMKAGVVKAFAEMIAGKVKSPRSVKLATWFIGLFTIDDYMSPLLRGVVMRPLTDEMRVPREKLAFILDSTCASVCTLMPFMAWGAYVAGLVADLGGPVTSNEQGVSVYISAIPFNFYAILMVLITLLSALEIFPDFGPMRKAEQRARTTGKLLRDGAVPMMGTELEELQKGNDSDVKPNVMLDFLVPIMILVATAIWTYIAKGGVKILECFIITVIYMSIELSIRKKFHKQLFSRFARGINDYELVKPGDKIAVCISGGKDSMLMAKLFQELQRHHKFPFEVVYLVMDPGYNERNRQIIEQNAKILNIPLTIFETNIFEAVYNIEKSPCYLCARMRRGHLYSKAKELGCNKIALGHHFDDVIETILMGMLYGGQVQTMMPKLHSTNFEGMELIRPLYLVREDDIKAWRDYNDLHFIQCACKFTDTCTTCNNEENQSKRVEIKELIKRLKQVNPYVEGNIFKSIENVNLSTVIAYKKDGVKHSFLEEYDD